MEKALLSKYDNLKKIIASYGSALVAFSSGVDSTFLLYAAKEALGENAGAVTVSSCFFPEKEDEEAAKYCESLGVRQFRLKLDVLRVDGVSDNPKNRCYLCKRALMGSIKELAEKNGYATVLEGSNLSDNDDYRPGMQAVTELGIKSPLKEAGFTKSEIREVSKQLGIPTWDKPSYACLASRFRCGDKITEEQLKMVERAEEYLHKEGFRQIRVRIHGRLARIEAEPVDFERIMKDEMREGIYTALKEIGFEFVSLDLFGYKTGSMN